MSSRLLLHIYPVPLNPPAFGLLYVGAIGHPRYTTVKTLLCDPEHALKVSLTLALLYPALTDTGSYIHLLYLVQILYILAEQDDKQLNRIRGVKFNGFAASVCGRKPCANLILLLFAFPQEHTSAVLHTSATSQSLHCFYLPRYWKPPFLTGSRK
jgi:hypothetical protein